MVFECEGSSSRALIVERLSVRGRGLYRARRQCAESGSLRHAVITVHIELPVLESHVAPIIIQRNYRYNLAGASTGDVGTRSSDPRYSDLVFR